MAYASITGRRCGVTRGDATAPVLNSTCASKARIIYGGRFHPESCRLIRKLTAGAAGQLTLTLRSP